EAMTTDLWGQDSNTAQADFKSPLTASISAVVLAGHNVELSGVVLGDQVAGLTVTFSGAYTGTATTDASGCYDLITTGASVGTVYAVVSGGYHVDSDPVQADILIDAPSLTLGITDSTGDTVTFCGTLTSMDSAWQTVSISGAPLGSVTTDANGNFTFTVN